MAKVVKTFWQGKRILITGHTGFKGSWLTLILKNFEAEICGYALAPNTHPSLFDLAKVDTQIQSHIGNILDSEKLNKIFQDFKPEIVFHLAAQPLVRESYANPIETFQTNIIGTANVLEACLKINSCKAVVVITTDKCYDNKEWTQAYRETDALGGHDPYSSSKGCAELIANSYKKSFFNLRKIPLATVRAGNVIGGGDWSKDRLIPDTMNSIMNNSEITLRNPNAIRPWQHVLEPLHGYMMLAEKMYTTADLTLDTYNLGPDEADTQSVLEIVNHLKNKYESGSQIKITPSDLHEAHFLKLDCTKIKVQLGWKPVLNINQTIDLIADWYQQIFAAKKNPRAVTLAQINTYFDKINA